MSIFFYSLYNLLLTLALPFVWVFAYFNEKLGSSFSAQKDIKSALDSFNNKVKHDPKPIVWLHAASAGEFEQIRPLIPRLRNHEVYIFQTFTSPTIYYKFSHSDLFDGVSFLPWDLYPRVNRFIAELRPQLFINTRHDIWPNLLLALHRNGIRNILINANLYQNSARLRPLVRTFNRSIFRYIDHIYTGSKDLKSLLRQLYFGPIDIVGDSRFDQVHERSLLNTDSLVPKHIIADLRVIVYGSTIDSDLQVVCSAIAKSLSDMNMIHIIVPHEIMERDLIPWERELFRHKIASIRYTELDDYKNEKVIIWNQIGKLADLYKEATLAYIGAGFSTGVHSVTEAAIYHVPSAHGPRYDILAEAIELVDSKLSEVVTSDDQLCDFLALDSDHIQQLSGAIAAFVKQRLGATDRIIDSEFSLDS
ncbi:MAG: hypothetical protein K9N35_06065 [Candidatus Marinimicrobia bacterium]|nr:hypothetical protein [Candidatus Neomarinimicrobiota bacterium]